MTNEEAREEALARLICCPLCDKKKCERNADDCDVNIHLKIRRKAKVRITKNKEKQIQEYKSKQLIDELSKMPPMVIATAYLHAINYTLYGEDVTEKWVTATQNASALEKAYMKGYYDALQRRAESEE